mmetsp:Transcript_15989/g.30101  ORF Transcript_15989/g.30101 Transcript_15989/m.30101 type:complete len:181 (+) Transcript_15989:53-595(+)
MAEPITLQAEVPEGVGPGVNFSVSTPDGQVLQLTCPDDVGPGMMVSFSYYPLEQKPEESATGVDMHEEDRARLEEGMALAAARQEELSAQGATMAVPPPPAEEFTGYSFQPAFFWAGQNALVTRSSGEESGCYILEVFLTALGPLYTVYLGQAEDGTYITKNCAEADLRAYPASSGRGGY